METTVVALHTSAALVERLKKLWEEYAVPARLVNIVDDSLIWEVIDNGSPTVSVKRRMVKYALAAEDLGADYIFNTCSSVGEVADLIRETAQIPVIKIDEPMALKAVKNGVKIGVLATLPSTVGPTSGLIQSTADSLKKEIRLVQKVAEGAFPNYMKGKLEEHNNLVRKAALSLAEEVDLIVLAQGSMSLLEEELKNLTGKLVLSSPVSGVMQFNEILKK